MRDELQQQLDDWMLNGRERDEETRALWRGYETVTHDLALGLCEQLRLILEPTLATRLKGDYRTGKRQFKKDKIWLRRTRPSKRQYQVLLAIDDSHSMAESHSIELAYESLALISRALMAVVGFGEQVLRSLTFKQTRTDVRQLMHTTSELLQSARYDSSSGSADLWQLQLIISDGICDDHARLAELVRAASERRVMTIFIYYVVLRRVELLPEVLADALRQYFSFVNGSH
ncbi:hypothetical protein BDF19DRAFT_471470 [Syncephalis fuscata]|nr:hypothetical protein BDF19DRAFT_471470 [Syncephalis fuscata]